MKGSSPNCLRPISYIGSIWELYVLHLKTKVFCGKRTSHIFPWKRDSQWQNRANSLASKNFSPFGLPKPKSFKFLKKSSLWVCVVRETTQESGDIFRATHYQCYVCITDKTFWLKTVSTLLKKKQNPKVFPFFFLEQPRLFGVETNTAAGHSYISYAELF